MSFQTLDQADLQGKRALVRVDFNVPMEDGQVTDDTRLRAAVPTIEKLRQGGAKVILLAHFDRPKGKPVPSMSLKPIVEPLAKVLGYWARGKRANAEAYRPKAGPPREAMMATLGLSADADLVREAA